ncbi:hypothetical protein DXG03_000389 [Asterophora parasitica]|uniref:Origin recognition complex subunit 4 n=1 Tax=Asterophora parasitica TaxID=117018 RepID=A0A9P7GGU5_9AGAR|nr:hypothetical protein DXG03_000389 [Asterophora parasitica]
MVAARMAKRVTSQSRDRINVGMIFRGRNWIYSSVVLPSAPSSMPPKRKATTTLPGASPTKRPARSKTPEHEVEPPEIGTPSKPKISTTPTTTPHRRVVTYSGKRASARRATRLADSLKEIGKDDGDAEEGEESIEDELDMLSSTKRITRRTAKLVDGSPDPPPTPATRTRSGRLLDTPTRRQSKRGQVSPSPVKSPAKPPTKPPTKSPVKSPVKGKGRMTSTKVTSDAEEPIENSSVRVTRIATAANGTLHGTLQVTKSQPAPSPKKRPLTLTKDDNVEPQAKASSPRKAPKRGVQQAAAEPVEKPKAPSPPVEPPTPSRAPTKRLPSVDNDPPSCPPAPLRFDSVMIPLVPKVFKAASLVPNASRSATPSAAPPPLPCSVTPSIAPAPLPRSVTPPPVTPRASPSKQKPTALSSPTRVPRALLRHLYPCVNAQKRAILRALQKLPDIADDGDGDDRGIDEDEEPSTNSVAAEQLKSLLDGTISRGEGNSCLVLGAKGSGKSRLVEECISSFSAEYPLIIRLSGWTQHSDRLAMREIAYQLRQQTGTSFLADTEDEPSCAAMGEVAEEANPFLDVPQSIQEVNVSLPPSSHLPALIGVLPTLSRPSIIILDGFDLFALHPRQSLLYCLLDTAQSCRAAAGTKGIAVIGVTSRIDTITTLEKRVKSRFSGRMLRTAPPRTLQVWEKIARAALSADMTEFMGDAPEEHDVVAEWQGIWDSVVEQFLTDKVVQTVMNETFSVTRDLRMLSRLLVSSIVASSGMFKTKPALRQLSVALRLSQESTILSASEFAAAAQAQRARPRFPLLHALPYPGICLLIASVHADAAGQANFTFEMLHEYFRDQVRASTSAPVHVNGGRIGMVRCSRQVLMTAFEDLIATKVFVPVAAYASSVAKEFIKYRSVVDREDVKKAVDKISQVSLKKWLTKAQ